MQRVSTATNKNPFLVSPKFYLNPPRVERTGVDRNPWLAKMWDCIILEIYPTVPYYTENGNGFLVDIFRQCELTICSLIIIKINSYYCSSFRHFGHVNK